MAATEKKTQFNIWYFTIALWLALAWHLYAPQQQTQQISFSQFEQSLVNHKIQKVRIDSQLITGDYVHPIDGKLHFVTVNVDHNLAAMLSKYGVDYSGTLHNTFLDELFSWVASALVFFLIWYFIFRKIAERSSTGSFMTIGSSKSKVYVHQDTGVTFANVAGVDEAKEELREIIDFLKTPQEYARLGARIPKGVLLVGPPGTGKTLLAKAVAGEAQVPFFSISGSEFIELFVGVGAARVRDLFEQARQQAPAIIFIDELDALGRARGAFPGLGGHDEREQTLNQLLAEMDGFNTREEIVILASTNRPEVLDPALLRAGRFDRQILVDRPDKNGRLQILNVHAQKVKLSQDIDLETIATITTGFSGADIANLVNEATLQATRRKADAVSIEDFTYAVERIVAGLEKKSRLLTPFERKVVAYHEMGHALVSIALPGVDIVHKVSIIPRGIGALGYTIQRPTEDRYLMTRTELENKIRVLLGGRAAEQMIFNHVSTGAADDLAKASEIARSMVTRYGMDEQLGCVTYEESGNQFLGSEEFGIRQKHYSEATSQKIDETVRIIVKTCFDQTQSILEQNQDTLESCVAELLKTESLEEERLRELTQFVKKIEDLSIMSQMSKVKV